MQSNSHRTWMNLCGGRGTDAVLPSTRILPLCNITVVLPDYQLIYFEPSHLCLFPTFAIDNSTLTRMCGTPSYNSYAKYSVRDMTAVLGVFDVSSSWKAIGAVLYGVSSSWKIIALTGCRSLQLILLHAQMFHFCAHLNLSLIKAIEVHVVSVYLEAWLRVLLTREASPSATRLPWG